MRRLAAIVLFAAAGIGHVGASRAGGEPVQDWQSTGSIERHFTSNALDSDRPVSDWYTLMRGTLQRQFGEDDAKLTLSGELQASRYDQISIEDDRALLLAAEAFRRFGAAVELRGTLSYRVAREGDDLSIGPLTLGTATAKQVLTGQLQLGLNLGKATTLILEASDSVENVGRTHFQHDILPATRLDPDRDKRRFAARVTRTAGRLAFGGSASALLVSVEELGTPPVGLSFAQYGLRAEAVMTGEDGSTLGLALGAELLRASVNGLYSKVRPEWQLTASKPLPLGFELRGAWFGRYETADSDDPLASWLQRAEVETSLKLREDLVLAAGVFRENKRNLLFENDERGHGFFAEATYKASGKLHIVARVDFSRTFKTVVGTREETTDIFIAMRSRL
ncbi:hypothetical protein [Mesorhizobium sp. BE184]|uniref:hypothetical protein n=1 Tax=Mesorhizobium sp. BE184 TaxID=2817714 RepID=UPI00285B531F|nr:hypothetical protein [Mesorhizobium sp. BE184]MDR7035084.1 hypothetical protein [Mesorhizobium sp. BE184]